MVTEYPTKQKIHGDLGDGWDVNHGDGWGKAEVWSKMAKSCVRFFGDRCFLFMVHPEFGESSKGAMLWFCWFLQTNPGTIGLEHIIWT